LGGYRYRFLFFGKHLIGAALVDITVLLSAIIVTTILFWRITPPAGWVMVPYVLWVGFASVLNYRFWTLN
jgi:tryptophan-rich sensory protein